MKAAHYPCFFPTIRSRILTCARGLAAGILLFSAVPAPTMAQALKKISFQQSWVSGVQYAGLYLAQEKGYFREAGLDVEFVPGGPNVDGTLNVVTGKSMIGDRPTDILITARGRGMPVKAIGSMYQYSPMSVMSLKATPIKTLAAMSGKTIAVAGGTRPIFVTLLKDADIDPAKVNFVPVGTDPSVLAAGQVDGYTGLDTNQGSMLRTKGVEIETLLVRDMGYHIYTGALYTTDETVAKNRGVLIGFLKAAARGHRYLVAHPEEAAKLTVDKFGAPGMDLAAATAEAKASVRYITDDGKNSDRLLWIDPAKIRKEIEVHVANGGIKTLFPATDLIDASLIRDVYATPPTATR